MKTPISYYGGKQTLLKHILPEIPKHTVYTEAFCGGAAVLFAKEPSDIEVINDINYELVNFYQVAKTKHTELKELVEASLHARDLHVFAQFIYNYPYFFSDVRRAWAVWVLSKMSFASKLDGSFGYDISKNTMSKKIANAKLQFDNSITERLERVTIENTDALRVIESRDSENTFHFVDPPYINSDCGHYKGYTENDFKRLLNLLSDVKGKFMLTMYPHALLENYTAKNNWHLKEVERTISASKTSRRKQSELIITNYAKAV